MKSTNLHEKIKQNDLFGDLRISDGSRYNQLDPKAFMVLCHLIYNAKNGKLTTSPGTIMHILKIQKAMIIRSILGCLKGRGFINSYVDLWTIGKSQFAEISVSTYKSKYISNLLKAIPYAKFQSISGLGYNYWAVYCYLFVQAHINENQYFTCTTEEIHSTLKLNKKTIRNILIALEVDNHLEIKRQSGVYREGFGRVTANLYKVLP